MAISLEEVKKIAALARLELTAAEEKRHAETISAVLDYMKILNEVKTDKIEPTFQVTGLAGIIRDDLVKDCEIKKELIKNMPQTELNELVVPAVFDKDGESA